MREKSFRRIILIFAVFIMGWAFGYFHHYMANRWSSEMLNRYFYGTIMRADDIPVHIEIQK